MKCTLGFLLILLTLTLGCTGEQAQIQDNMAAQTTAPPIIKKSFVELGTLEEFETNMADALENPIFEYVENDGVNALLIYQGDRFKNSEELSNWNDVVPDTLMKKGTVDASKIPYSKLFEGTTFSEDSSFHKVIVDYAIDNLIVEKPNEIAYWIFSKSCDKDEAKLSGSEWDTIDETQIYDKSMFNEYSEGDNQKLDIYKFWIWCNRYETLTIYGFTDKSIDFFFK